MFCAVGDAGPVPEPQHSTMSPSTPAMEPERSSEEPVFVAPQPRRSTLAERASRASRDQGFSLGLSMETIQASSRDAEEEGGAPAPGQSETKCPASFRGWHVTEEGRFIPTTCDGSLRVMSYNILASRYVTTDRYPLCPTWALAEEFRCKQIHREVRGCDPDVICLQEMSVGVFSHPGLLGDLLRRSGFEGQHVVVTGKCGEPIHVSSTSGVSTGGETSSSSSSTSAGSQQQPQQQLYQVAAQDAIRTEFEGVAIFYKSDRFNLLEVSPIRFNSLADRDKTLLPQERARLTVTSHNVALVVVLHDRITGGVIIAGTLHVIWDVHGRPECQLYQLHHLVVHMEELKGMYEHMGETSVLLMGDFNAELNSYALNYCLSNDVQQQQGVSVGARGGGGGTSGVSSTASSAFSAASAVSGGSRQRPPLPNPMSSGGAHSRLSEVTSPLELGGGARGCGSEPTSSLLLSSPGMGPTSLPPWPPTLFSDWVQRPRSHSLSLRDAYAAYCSRFGAKVSAVNPSTNGEGKVIDHILYDHTSLICVAVGRLGDKNDIPNRSTPSDHYPVAATFVPVHRVVFSHTPLVAESDGDDDTDMVNK